MNRTTTLTLSLLLAASGCGDDDRPDVDMTVGTDAGPGVDVTAPTVVDGSPEDGSTDVPLSSEFVATFSEEMGTEGTVDVTVEGARFEADITLDGETLTVSAPDGWPSFSEVAIRIGADFEDTAGNALDRSHAFRFTTTDAAAPMVVQTTPAEGDDTVETRLGAVRIRFSEPMDQAAGSVTLEGGPGAIDVGRAEWSTFEVVYPIEGLANATDYRVVLSGFQDRVGNAADLSALGDDAIDFTTRPDDEAPQVVSSTPNEGQLDVLLESLAGAITVTFDEAMDTTAATAPFTAGAASADVAITWIDDRTASFAIAGVAVTEAMHSLDLRALTDVAGNVLATAPVVRDGRLDFNTGIDSFVPFVAASTPLEGSTGVSFPLDDVVLAFSESMDTTVTEVAVRDDIGGDHMVAGSWGSGGTVLTIPGSEFGIGLTYEVDVSGLVDLAGSSVSVGHPYLGDGVLDFDIELPTGESCDLALRTIDGDEVSPGVFAFDITRAQRTRNNGSGSCDADGIAETDAVIHYVKTTPELSDPSGAGRALRVMTDATVNRTNLEVFSGSCDPTSATAVRQICFADSDTIDQLLDVPAGEYWIWVSTNAGSPTDIDVQISEVDSIPEGERCEDPFDTSSPEYTPPATPDGHHLWTLPTGTYNSLDASISNGPGEALSCAARSLGDFVIEYEKTDPTSVLDVTIRSDRFSIRAELLENACTRGSGGTTALCEEFVGEDGERFTADVGAGTHYLWLSGGLVGSPFQGGEVAIREVPAPTAPGSSCANAIPLTPSGTVAITPDHAERYFAPSCTPTTSNVTWYSFTTTTAVTEIFGTGDGAVGLVDATSGDELGCDAGSDGDSVIRRFAPVGTQFCLGVQTDGSVSELRFENKDYTGPGLTAPTSLNIDAPADLSGTPYLGNSVNGGNYLLLTSTTLYQPLGTAGMYYAPKTGGTRLQARFDVENLGNGGARIGDATYTIDYNGGQRIQQLTDATGAWNLEYVDPGADYDGNTRGLGTDGTYLYTVIHSTSSSTRDAAIYRLDPSAPSTPTLIGRVGDIYSLVGITADAEYIYLTGQTSTSAKGVYRLAIASLDPDAVSSPELLTSFGSSLATTSQTLELLTTGAGDTYLYLRDTSGRIHVIADPGGTFDYLGVLLATDSSDDAFGFDDTGALFVFGTHLEPEGQWYRYDPM